MNIIDVKKVENLLKSEISTYKISKETGITATTLHRYRSGEGETKNMRLETAEKLYEMALIEEQKNLDQAAKIEDGDESKNTTLDESSHREKVYEEFLEKRSGGMFFDVVDERIFDLTTEEFVQLMLDIGTRTRPPIDEIIRESEKEYNDEDKKTRDNNRNNLVASLNYQWFVPEDIRYWFIKRSCDDERIAELDEILERIEVIEEVVGELSDIKTPHRFELYNTIEVLRQQVIRSFDDK